MRISVFTSNQARHQNFVKTLAQAGHDVVAVMEATSSKPWEKFGSSQTMKHYFEQMCAAERKVFGNVGILPANVRVLPLMSGDLSDVPLDALAPALEADLIFVFGSSYIKRPLIDVLMQKGACNLHMGLSPFYRGAACNFWALYDGRVDLVGATIHVLTTGLDAGPIFFHALPPAIDTDGFTLGMLAVKSAHEAVLESIQTGKLFKLKPIPQDSSLEIRVCKVADFNEAVASDYLSRQISPHSIGDRLRARDLSLLVQPYVPAPSAATASPPKAKAAPLDCSIVVATKNRAALLKDMLSSLEAATRGISYEVVAIEGGSSDGSRELLEQHPHTRAFDEKQELGPGKHSWPRMYNFGFQQARGRWVIFASDDVTFEANCFSNAIALLDGAPESVAGGVFFYRNEIAETGWDRFGIDFLARGLPLLNYGLVSKQVLEQLGYLSMDYQFYCADGDLTYAIANCGKTLVPLAGSSVVHHNLLDTQKQLNLEQLAKDRNLFRTRWAKLGETGEPVFPRRFFFDNELTPVFSAACHSPWSVLDSNKLWLGIALAQQGELKAASDLLSTLVHSTVQSGTLQVVLEWLRRRIATISTLRR